MDWLLKILEGLIIGIGIPLGIPFCLNLLARLLPFKPQILPQEPVSFDELKSKYSNLMAASMIPCIAFWVVSSYLVYQSLVWIFHQSLPDGDENRYLMPFYQRLFLCPTIFIGLYLAIFLTDLLYRLRLKEKYAEYTLYGD